MTLDALTATSTVTRRLLPALMLRGAVYVALVLGVMAMTALGAFLGVLWDLMRDMSGGAVHVGAALGFAVGVLLFRALNAHILYLVEASYAALGIAACDGAELPQGRAQVGFGARAVSARFASTREIAAFAACLRDTLHSLPKMIQGVQFQVLPGAGLRRFQRLQRALLQRATGALQPVLLAHTLRAGAGNPWHAGRHALVLHAQAGQSMLTHAARVSFTLWAGTGLIFLGMLFAGDALAHVLPGDWHGETLACAVLLTWAAKSALLDPIALIHLIRISLDLTDPLRPNPDWTDKLDSAAPAFHAMGRRAVAWQTPPSTRSRQPHPSGSGETQGG